MAHMTDSTDSEADRIAMAAEVAKMEQSEAEHKATARAQVESSSESASTDSEADRIAIAT